LVSSDPLAESLPREKAFPHGEALYRDIIFLIVLPSLALNDIVFINFDITLHFDFDIVLILFA